MRKIVLLTLALGMVFILGTLNYLSCATAKTAMTKTIELEAPHQSKEIIDWLKEENR